ncbi:AF4/FMR2 family member 1-like isoform X2 [Pectinophora gossypiella]|uniref:AF4/FMR2 family member 1-like isoform X2 n=1 Tax=Pectinophora gossypiella TaxID=13191 RepID=UPI00214EAD6E|nr:AF4/FMR2 family member 1-like isoform X2 [Pectinophora gossypiella]
MHMCYERPGLVTALNGGTGYDKWERAGSGGGSGGGGGPGGSWAGRDRERDRERERQARAHQMSHAHAAEPDASSLFPAPFRVTGNSDRVSQQIRTKLGDYNIAQTLLDDPSKSIGICAEPASPAPCPPSRRESEFKKPAHAPQNGRVHHRPYMYNKSDAAGSTGAPAHRPPNLRIPNGFQAQNAIDSSQPPIESILKEMKSLPTPLSVIAATPRKELENKFTFNPHTKCLVQETPQPTNDLKTPPLPKPGLDNRISNSRSSVSPDVVNKDLGLSESDDEVAATTTRLEPILSPIGSGGSPSSGSESSPSDSESESSSGESVGPAAAPAAAPPAPAPPALRSSWSLSNFAPPPAHPPDQPYESKELRHALADVKGKPSPISDLSSSETSSPSPGARRRRSTANRSSAVSSDDEPPRPSNTTSPRLAATAVGQQAPLKRGRPPKKSTSEPPKKKRGRPRKQRATSPVPPAGAERDTRDNRDARDRERDNRDSEPETEPTPAPHAALHDTKTHIFRKVFTPKKDEGGKGGKGGKGKGGKGKGQVTIIEVTAPESGADDDERRNEEALARLSPPPEDRRREERQSKRGNTPRSDYRRPEDRVDRNPDRTADRIQTERTSNDRIQDRDRMSSDRLTTDRLSSGLTTDRLVADRLSSDRLTADRLTSPASRLTSPAGRLTSPANRLTSPAGRLTSPAGRLTSPAGRLTSPAGRLTSPAGRHPNDRLSADRHDRLTSDRLSSDRLSSDRISSDRLGVIGSDRLSIGSDRLSIGSDRVSSERSSERVSGDKTTLEHTRVSGDKAPEKIPLERAPPDKTSVERVLPDRYVRAEADVGSGIKSGRGSERLEEASSNVAAGGRTRLVVRVPLSRLRSELARALQRPPPSRPTKRRQAPPSEQGGEVAATNHERSGGAGRTPIYYSYFERLPADALSDEERDHKYYLGEAKRLRTAAEREQEPLARVMLYLESVLCFVLTGRVLELELDTKRAFTIYRETIEYIKSIHSMPQRFRASPHSTFSKLDILSLRVQALLYLRMFKMYNREVKEYYKIVQEYQQKPACAESVSPLSPSPSPAGSVGSAGSASSGYCSLAHSVPAHAHHALLQLTKYYTFLYVAHELWEQADCLCRLRPNQDLFIAVDRKCGPLTLFSTFRHLVQYVRHAISLLKHAPRE